MKKKVFCFLVILLISLPVLSKKDSDARFYFFNLALFHPLSLNQSKLDSAAIDLSFIYGHVGYIRGVSLGMGVGVVEKRIKGLQMYGMAGISLNRLSGAQLSGLFNFNGGKARGVQMAGIFNLNQGSFNGLQWALGFNLNQGDFIGSQAAFLFNITCGNIQGAQTAPLMNISKGRMRGLQAGILNMGSEVTGLQLGVFNFSKNLDGVQIGLFNFAKKRKGVQVGVFNIAPGLKVGLTLWGGNTIALNTGIKLMLNDVYTILYSGGVDPGTIYIATITYGLRHGHRFSFGRFFLDIDGGYQYLDRGTFFKSKTGNFDSHMLSLRASISLKIFGKFSLFFGTGLACKWESYCTFKSNNIEPLFFIGLDVI